MKALNINNLPTPKDERWKYTNLPRAVPQGLAAASSVQEEIIHISRGQVCGEIRDISFTGESGKTHAPSLKITLEENAELTLVERHIGQGEYWKNMVSEITLGANASLRHIRIVEDSEQGVNTNMVSVELARDANYNAFTLNIGGKLTRHDIEAVLNGENGECSFNGLNLLSGDQLADTTILMEHKAPHCNSNQFCRSVLDGASTGVFQGKVYVHKPAQKTDGYQLSNALLLSEKAQMNAKPELEIYADDVLCSHGATCGQLDDEPLFYLRSRGLTEAEARYLLVEAFVGEVVDKIADDEIRSEIAGKAGAWLQTALS